MHTLLKDQTCSNNCKIKGGGEHARIDYRIWPKKDIYVSERDQLLYYQSKNSDQDCKKIKSLILFNSMFNMNIQQCPKLSSSEFSLKALIPHSVFSFFSHIPKSSYHCLYLLSKKYIFCNPLQ